MRYNENTVLQGIIERGMPYGKERAKKEENL